MFLAPIGADEKAVTFVVTFIIPLPLTPLADPKFVMPKLVPSGPPSTDPNVCFLDVPLP